MKVKSQKNVKTSESLDNTTKNIRVNEKFKVSSSHRNINMILYTLLINFMIIFISFYDFSWLASWYLLYNFELPNIPMCNNPSELGSYSSNPYMPSMPNYRYNPLEYFEEHLFTDTMIKSRMKVNKEQREMKKKLYIKILAPINNKITNDPWLKWSVRGSALDLPLSEDYMKESSDYINKFLTRTMYLDIQINRLKLKVSNAENISIILNGRVSLLFIVVLDIELTYITYLTEFRYELRFINV